MIEPMSDVYEILQSLGRGGMGEVFVAQDKRLNRLVAIKVIRIAENDPLSKEALSRFQREINVLATLAHENIARIFDVGIQPTGAPYFVMEYINGEPLQQFADRLTLPIPSRLALFLQVCDGVFHAHRCGVLHRDLKPGNILAFEKDAGLHAKVIDFGLAKLIRDRDHAAQITADGFRMGTPAYMSPEQAASSRVLDVRSDVYSLGIILFELIVGARPFEGKQEQVLRLIREADPPSLSERFGKLGDKSGEVASLRRATVRHLSRTISGDLQAILSKALRRERDDRYTDVRALADDIQRWLDGKPVLAARGRWTYPIRKHVRRHAVTVAAGVFGAATCAAVAGAILFSSGRRAAEAAAESQSARAIAERDNAIRRLEQDLQQVQADRTVQQKRAETLFRESESLQKQLLDATRNTVQATTYTSQRQAQVDALLRAIGFPPSDSLDDPRIGHRLVTSYLDAGRAHELPDLLRQSFERLRDSATMFDVQLINACLHVLSERREFDPSAIQQLERDLAAGIGRINRDASKPAALLQFEALVALRSGELAPAMKALKQIIDRPDIAPSLKLEITLLARTLNDLQQFETCASLLTTLDESIRLDPAIEFEWQIASLATSRAQPNTAAILSRFPGDAGWRPLNAKNVTATLSAGLDSLQPDTAERRLGALFLRQWSADTTHADAIESAFIEYAGTNPNDPRIASLRTVLALKLAEQFGWTRGFNFVRATADSSDSDVLLAAIASLPSALPKSKEDRQVLDKALIDLKQQPWPRSRVDAASATRIEQSLDAAIQTLAESNCVPPSCLAAIETAISLDLDPSSLSPERRRALEQMILYGIEWRGLTDPNFAYRAVPLLARSRAIEFKSR